VAHKLEAFAFNTRSSDFHLTVESLFFKIWAICFRSSSLFQVSITKNMFQYENFAKRKRVNIVRCLPLFLSFILLMLLQISLLLLSILFHVLLSHLHLLMYAQDRSSEGRMQQISSLLLVCHLHINQKQLLL
jgi:hypothetical protein